MAKGRTAAPKSAEEWRNYYLNKPIINVIDELIDAKEQLKGVITAEKAEQLKEEVAKLKKIETAYNKIMEMASGVATPKVRKPRKKKEE